MDTILSVVLVLCAGFAGIEAVTVGAAAQSAMHQIYAALWGVAFICAVAGVGIINAVRGAVKPIGEKLDKIVGMLPKEASAPEEAKERP